MVAISSNPRAEASRRNGAKSKGPSTAEGKARASKNALKHGLRASGAILLGDEDEKAFAALEQGLFADLQPEGPLEALLAKRLATAAWRMDRADRIEADLLTPPANRPGSLGEKITRDRHGPQAVDCLIRYRNAAQAEFWRTLAALRAVQSQKEDNELSDRPDRQNFSPAALSGPGHIDLDAREAEIARIPNEPERR